MQEHSPLTFRQFLKRSAISCRVAIVGFQMEHAARRTLSRVSKPELLSVSQNGGLKNLFEATYHDVCQHGKLSLPLQQRLQTLPGIQAAFIHGSVGSSLQKDAIDQLRTDIRRFTKRV